jgi:hypothetical protein
MDEWRFLKHPSIFKESWAGPLLCIAGLLLFVFKQYFEGVSLFCVGALTIYYYYDDQKPGRCTDKPSEVAPTNDEYEKLLAEKGLAGEDDRDNSPPMN